VSVYIRQRALTFTNFSMNSGPELLRVDRYPLGEFSGVGVAGVSTGVIPDPPGKDEGEGPEMADGAIEWVENKIARDT
jgi:hypothetical protein